MNNYYYLIKQLSITEIKSKYKGSALGFLWSVLTPLVMLIIYTFVFSTILNARWDIITTNKLEFAVILFCGIITFNLFSEVINNSTAILLRNVNYITKVVFPLGIFPFVLLISSLFNFSIGFILLVLANLFSLGVIHWTILLLPFVLLPIILITLGVSWFLSSLGVYFRDINYIVSLFLQGLMFLSPIFYPISIIPVEFRFVYYLNPFTSIIESIRNIVIWGKFPLWDQLLVWTIIGAVLCVLGYKWFDKTKGGFSDVL